MYLRARRYVSGYQRINTDAEMNEWERQIDLFQMQDFVTDASPHGYVEFCIGYWRKAHDVHSWFVRNVQGGVDECQPTRVSREQLEQLRTESLRVLADLGHISPDEDSELGWAKYQYRQTVDQIDKALKLDEDHWEIIYQSSW
jgi:hypothetical protein